ncbi:MAG: hypothetical protein GY711_19175 [bacterium]|nr:hypothetical protein [bacterium]
MPSWMTPLSEELQEVLRDVAQDPRSTLFRVSGNELPDEPVSEWSAGWTVAERELLRVYREEVGLLLRDVMRFELRRSERGRNLFRFPSLPHYASATVKEPSLLRRASAYRDLYGADDLPPAVSDVMESLATEPTGKSRVSRVGAAASSLADNDSTAILHAMCQVSEGLSDRQTIERLRSVAECSQSQYYKAMAWSNIGLVNESLRQPTEAWRAYRRASALWPEATFYRVCWLGNALLACDDSASQAAREALAHDLGSGSVVANESIAKLKWRCDRFYGGGENDFDWSVRLSSLDAATTETLDESP